MPDFVEYRGKRVLITGGLGFIGSNLAIKLVELGADVDIMDCRLDGHGHNDFNLEPVKDKVHVYDGDIRNRRDADFLITNKDFVFSLAGHVGEKPSEENPYLDLEINVLGHYNILESCVENNPTARVLFSGSRLQYGKTGDTCIVSENHPMNPITPYATNKMNGELMHLDYCKKHGLQTTVLRIANPYGPRALISNPSYCIVNWFVGKAIDGENLTIYGDGKQLRDYIYIDDLVDAFLTLGIHPKAPGEVFNVGSGNGTPFKNMAGTVLSLTGGSGKITHIDWPKEAKKRETGHYVADISKIVNMTNWTSRVSLRDGLEKTIGYYRQNLEHYKHG